MLAVPNATPVTTPVPDTVATPVLPLDHVPPGDESPNVVVDPTQTDSEPVMAGGAASTVKVAVVVHPKADV